MDYRGINFDWNHAKAFLVTAQEGSLSAGARALGLTQPTLGRQVAALEEKLGVALFERHGRGLSLTPTGLKLVEHLKAMSEAASMFTLAASGQSDLIEGNVVISASEAIAAFNLPEMLLPLREQHPGIRLEIIASSAASDLRKREADIAIRGFRPLQPDLIVKRLADIEYSLYAASSYLSSLQQPLRLSDVNQACFLGFNHGDEMIKALNGFKIPVTSDNFPIVCENHLVQWELVKNGYGIGVMPVSVGDNEPLVQRVFPNMNAMTGELWLVAHRELRSSRRIRVVFDFLSEAFHK